MSENARVDLELINSIMNARQYINQLNLWEIDFYENGEKIDIPKETIDDFMFTGLSNIDFISSNYYRKGPLPLTNNHSR